MPGRSAKACGRRKPLAEEGRKEARPPASQLSGPGVPLFWGGFRLLAALGGVGVPKGALSPKGESPSRALEDPVSGKKGGGKERVGAEL